MKNVANESIEFVAQFDPELASLMNNELVRQRRNIELIASENMTSQAVMAAMGSVLTNKYAEGLPAKRYYGGCECVDVLETLAIDRAKKLFGCDFANVQPHSGAQANTAVYAALLQPGDKVVGMNLANGGHLTHGSPANISGKYFDFAAYGINAETGRIDYNEVEDIVKKHQPKMVVAGASAYPRAIDFQIFAEIAHKYGALLMVDMAHIAGLVAGGSHMSPVPYADIVTTTTHKTLRGPRGGMIMAKEEFAKKLNSGVFPGTQGGPLMHVIAAKAVCFQEAMNPEFKEYAHNTVTNAKALAEALLAKGFDLVTGGTDNHLMLTDLRPLGINGRDFQNNLDEAFITANKNAIPNDPQKPTITSGVRLGTPAVTTRGMGPVEMVEIADCLHKIAVNPEGNRAEVQAQVTKICDRFPLY
ncbi:MAG: serine hydroxymethyltransferase [Eubacteriales bacterium]